MTDPRPISPIDAAALLQKGAQLFDIRESDERRSGVIPAATHAPLSALANCELPTAGGRPVIFHCKSGGRTAMNAEALGQKAGDCDAYLLEGGIEAWRDAGLPVARAE